MTVTRHLRLGAIIAVLAALGVVVVSCQRGSADGDPDFARVFGNGYKDASTVIAKVGEISITRDDFDRRFAELPDKLKKQYSGEGWEKRFLRLMTDEALLFQEARKRHLSRNPKVAQALISSRREVLVTTLRDEDLMKDVQPTEQEIRTHFERNRASYMAQGLVLARHVQCKDSQTAQAVYEALRKSKAGDWEFARQVALHSTNPESAKQAGSLGWFSRAGFMPALAYGGDFSQRVWDFPIGLHEPFEMRGEWHVVEIQKHEQERELSLEEARDQVVTALTPLIKQKRLEAFLQQARQATRVQYFGGFTPGGGINPRELIRLAQYAPTPEEKIPFYKQILDDYADTEFADDALFLLANLYYDSWGDIPFASRYLDQLLEKYPDSEYADQARYMLANMGKPGFMHPKSVEDLRQSGQ